MKRRLTAVLTGLLCIATSGLGRGLHGSTPSTANTSKNLVTIKTLTVFPNPTRPGTTSVDGDIGTNSNTDYATAHSIANCTDCSTPGTITTEHSVGVVSGVTLYSVIRAVLNFDTSVLPPSAVISSATLSVKTQAQHLDYQTGDSVRLVRNSISSDVNYATSDFNSIGTQAQATADIAVASMSTGVYNDFTLNTAGIANINRTGVSHFGLRLVSDINGTQPVPGTDPDNPYNNPTPGGALAFFDSAETGISASPKLVITYTDSDPGLPPLLGVTMLASKISGTAPYLVTLTATTSLVGSSFAWTKNGTPVGNGTSSVTLLLQTRGSYLITVNVTNGIFQASASATVVAN